jgi:hypothetical protein
MTTDEEIEELIARLKYAKTEAGYSKDRDLIRRLKAERDEARKALEPFAIAAKGFDHPRVKNPDEWMAYSGIGTGGIDREGAITVTHLRAAARILSPKRHNSPHTIPHTPQSENASV